MTDGDAHSTVDEPLDAFIAAWHAGEAPSSVDYAGRAPAEDHDELTRLIASFLELAPTTQPSESRSRELAADPLVAKIAALEGRRWDALESSL